MKSVYYPNYRRASQIALVLYGILFLILIIVLFDLRMTVYAIVLFVIALFGLSDYLYAGFFDRLVISPDGLEFHSFGKLMFVEWKNLEQGTINNQRLFRRIFEGIFLDASLVQIKYWLPILLNRERKTIVISLNRYSKNWRDSEFGQQIKQYAPNLFEKEKSV